MNDMKEINDEINLTLSLMQLDIYEGILNELQYHLDCLLEMKRNVIQRKMAERVRSEPDNKPLTTDEIKAGGWWCDEVSERVRCAFALHGFNVADQWTLQTNGCRLAGNGSVTRFNGQDGSEGLRKIELRDGDFYWSEKMKNEKN